MHQLVLIRHGESLWNRDNRFTGWTDVPLTERGIEEAREAGRLLKQNGFTFDLAFVSVLTRALNTFSIIAEELGEPSLPAEHSWRLNERHYGSLQGLNKAETAAKYGEQQVLIWRRSYDVPPPPLDPSDERWPGHDPRYALLKKEEIPLTESLKETVARVIPYWEEKVVPALHAHKKILLVAHGNSIRALIKHLDHLSEEEVLHLNIPTAVPLVYELDEKLHPLRHYYLGDQAKINAAIQSVASQGKQKEASAK